MTISIKFSVHVGGQGTKCPRKIAEIYNRLSRVHERYRRQTDDRRQRQTDGRQHIANVNMSSRSLKIVNVNVAVELHSASSQYTPNASNYTKYPIHTADAGATLGGVKNESAIGVLNNLNNNIVKH